MDDIYKTSRQICPHCHMETEVPIEVGGKKFLLDNYTCRRCGKKFFPSEAVKYDTCKTIRQICPHCYKETDVLIDVGDEDSVMGTYACMCCKKKFTLLDAAKAKVSKNTGVYPGQNRTSPFYLEGVPPNSNAAKTHNIIAAILLIGIPISFRLAEKYAMKGSFGKFSQAAYDYLSDLFLKVLMGGDINTGSLEAFIRLGLFCAVFFAILYSVVKIFRLDRKIVIKFKK